MSTISASTTSLSSRVILLVILSSVVSITPNKTSKRQDIFSDKSGSNKFKIAINSSNNETIETTIKSQVKCTCNKKNYKSKKVNLKKKINLYTNEEKHLMSTLSENVNSELAYEGEYIKVSSKEKNVYIDKTGKITTNKEIYINSILFAVSQNSKWGFEDKNNQIKVECIYDQVTEFNEYGFAGIMKDGKWGVIDNTGKVILEPTYKLKDTEKPDFLGSYYKVTYGYGECYYTNKN